jgi:hypothetical protein
MVEMCMGAYVIPRACVARKHAVMGGAACHEGWAAGPRVPAECRETVIHEAVGDCTVLFSNESQLKPPEWCLLKTPICHGRGR